MKEIRCKECNRKPEKIRDYIFLAKDMKKTPDEAVIYGEGTYNEETGKFYCTECYVMLGCPLGTA